MERQKEHHTQHTTLPILERTEGEAVGLLRESVTPYALNNDEWRSELENLGNVL